MYILNKIKYIIIDKSRVVLKKNCTDVKAHSMILQERSAPLMETKLLTPNNPFHIHFSIISKALSSVTSAYFIMRGNDYYDF